MNIESKIILELEKKISILEKDNKALKEEIKNLKIENQYLQRNYNDELDGSIVKFFRD